MGRNIFLLTLCLSAIVICADSKPTLLLGTLANLIQKQQQQQPQPQQPSSTDSSVVTTTTTQNPDNQEDGLLILINSRIVLIPQKVNQDQ